RRVSYSPAASARTATTGAAERAGRGFKPVNPGASARAGGACRVPRLRGLSLTVAQTRAAHAGCRLRVRGAALEGTATQTVARQSPRARSRSSGVTVWLSPVKAKANDPPQGR